jgi:FAD/FMN-containing dehydrogenase
MELSSFVEYLESEEIAYQAEDTTTYMSDASFLTLGRPGLVIFPFTEEQLCGVVGFASRNRIALTPRAKGSGTAGASLAPEGGVMVVTDRLGVVNRFGKRLGVKTVRLVTAEGEEIAADKLHQAADLEVYARVGAGLTTEELDRYLAPYHWHTAVVPSSGWSTIGGNFSTNAGGNGTPKYGTFKHVVNRLRMVCSTTDGDGVAVRTVLDRQTIIDMGGGHGLYGIITELDVRIVPNLGDEEVYCAVCHHTTGKIEALGTRIGEFMSAMQEACHPEIAEFLMIDEGIFGENDPLLKDPEIAPLFDYPAGQYRMITMYMGQVRDMEQLERVASSIPGIEFVKISYPAFKKMLDLRKSATGKSPGRVALPGFEDIYVKDPKYLGKVFDAIYGITTGRLPGRPIGHQYTGGVVVHYRPQARATREEYAEAWRLTQELTDAICCDTYQTVKRPEHGLGLEVFSLASQEDRARILRLREMFDPAGIFQPHLITEVPAIRFVGERFEGLAH